MAVAESLNLISQHTTLLFGLVVVITIFAILLLYFKKWLFCKRKTNVQLWYQSNYMNDEIIANCPELRKSYTPPCLLRLGVAGTLMFGHKGRYGSMNPDIRGVRKRLTLDDGSVISIDLFLEPEVFDPLLENVMLVLCLGLSNHSGSDYVRSYIEYALSQGYKLAVLNHIGSIPDEVLTPEAPRIYTYGGTGDYAAVVNYVIDNYPEMKLFGIGFSLGANQIMKYLGEEPSRQKHFIGFQSWCQGYDANLCDPHLSSIKRGSLLFNHLICRKQKNMLLERHLDVLFNHRGSINSTHIEPHVATNHTEDNIINSDISPDSPLQPAVLQDTVGENSISDWAPIYASVTRGRPPDLNYPERDINGFLYEGWNNIAPINRDEINQSKLLNQIDDTFTRRFLGFNTVRELYAWTSCRQHMDQIRSLPALLVNGRDDPLIPWHVVRDVVLYYCNSINENAIGVCTSHGGHLSFFEGNCCSVRRVTWLDKLSISHVRAVVQMKLGDQSDCF